MGTEKSGKSALSGGKIYHFSPSPMVSRSPVEHLLEIADLCYNYTRSTYACSSVDRAIASGAMCDGSIPSRRTIKNKNLSRKC